MYRNATLEDIRQMADNSRDALWTSAKSAGHDCPKIYLHWTAGHYGQKFDDYHILIDEDGTIITTCDDLSELKSHTWRRNTGSVGVSLLCAVGATTDDLGSEPPTAKQIEMMSQVIAALCLGLWLTPSINCVLTHGEAADNEDGDTMSYDSDECYGPKTTVERWDLEYLGTSESPSYNPWATDGSRGGDILRGKANWYMAKFNNQSAQMYKDEVKEVQKMLVFINPGHAPDGNPDPGAVGNGLEEALVVRECGDLVAKYLEAAGLSTQVVQDDSLQVICSSANNTNADIFISIHCNAANGNASGTETYYYGDSKRGKRLAQAIQNQLVTSLSVSDRGVKDGSTLYVLKNTDMSAILVEMAFIDNESDASLLKNNLDDFARAIARGVTDFYSAE